MLAGTFFGTLFAAFAAARRGAKKTANEVGSAPKPPDMVAYVLEEVRLINKKLDVAIALTREMARKDERHYDNAGRFMDEAERTLDEVKTDSKVIKELIRRT